MHPALNQWLESMNKASGGTLTGKLFPAQQLGKAEDHYDMARDGIAEFTYISVGYQPGRLPIAEGGNLLFLFNDADAGSRAYDCLVPQICRPGDERRQILLRVHS